MKTLKYLQIAVGVGVLASGCVHERVTYVTQVPPVSAPPPSEPQPPPAPAPILRSSAELDRMLAPIALYPDPLTAQILPAATVPDQVAAADRYVRQGRDLNRVDYEPWDESVKVLTRYPDVLRMMGGNLPWTTDLGIAFVNQGQDVMDSIQRLRAQARAIGNLRSTPEQVVIIDGRVIQIVPANPQIIYVPVYRPEVVYVQPPPRTGFHIYFGTGRPIGPWLNHDLNWRDRDVIVWQRDHPRPRNWWYEPPSRQGRPDPNDRGRDERQYTVWNPRNREGSNRGGSQAGRDQRDSREPRSPVQPPSRSGNPRSIPAPKNQEPPPVVRDGRSAPAPDTRERPAPPVRRPGPGQVSERTNNPAPPVVRDLPTPVPPRQGSPTPRAPAGSDVVSTPPPARNGSPLPNQPPPALTNVQPAPPVRSLPPRAERPSPGRTNVVRDVPPVQGQPGPVPPAREGQPVPVVRDVPPPQPARTVQTNSVPPAQARDHQPAERSNAARSEPRERANIPPSRPGTKGNSPNANGRPSSVTNSTEAPRGNPSARKAQKKGDARKTASNPTNTVPVTNEVDKPK